MIEINLSEDSLTIGDLEEFEDITGVSFDEGMKPVHLTDDSGNLMYDDKGRPTMGVKPSMKMVIALAYISAKKSNPNVTLDDIRNTSVKDFAFTGAEVEDETLENLSESNAS